MPTATMKLKHVFIAILSIRCLFLALPNKMVSPFLLASEEMSTVTAYTYAWAFFELVAFFVIALLFWLVLIGKVEVTTDRAASVGAFLLMCGIDFLDFVIRGNSEWFYVGSYPVTNNVFMAVCYPLLTYNLE